VLSVANTDIGEYDFHDTEVFAVLRANRFIPIHDTILTCYRDTEGGGPYEQLLKERQTHARLFDCQCCECISTCGPKQSGGAQNTPVPAKIARDNRKRKTCTPPENLDTSYGGIKASTFQGVATLITPAGPFEMKGARQHLLSKIFSCPGDIKPDLNTNRLFRKTMDKDTNCRSFAWKVLRQAKLAMGATTYVGDTALAAPPFFNNVVRGNSTIWGFETFRP